MAFMTIHGGQGNEWLRMRYCAWGSGGTVRERSAHAPVGRAVSGVSYGFWAVCDHKGLLVSGWACTMVQELHAGLGLILVHACCGITHEPTNEMKCASQALHASFIRVRAGGL